jgi:hypothetical protein
LARFPLVIVAPSTPIAKAVSEHIGVGDHLLTCLRNVAEGWYFHWKLRWCVIAGVKLQRSIAAEDWNFRFAACL